MSDTNDVKIAKLETEIQGIKQHLANLSEMQTKNNESIEKHFSDLTTQLNKINNSVPNQLQEFRFRLDQFEKEYTSDRKEFINELNRLDTTLEETIDVQQDHKQWFVKAGTVWTIVGLFLPLIYYYITTNFL